MFSSLLLVACLSASALAIQKPYYDINKAEKYFREFKQKYEKIYDSDEEEAFRYETFVDNLKMVNKLNTKNDMTAFGISPLMDLAMDEIVKDHTGLSQGEYREFCTKANEKDIHDDPNIPESWDWRNFDILSRVKDQGKCSCSWAFSAIGQLESLYTKKYGEKIEFSEQQVLDCNRVSDGCCGGFVGPTFPALNNTNGPVASKYLPYLEVKTGDCIAFMSIGTLNVTSCTTYYIKSQEKLKQLLYQHGPVSVGIKSSGIAKHYIQGIITDDFCAEGNLDHNVLLVGYGSENNVPYWVLKNSWGENFGEGGFFRIQRGDAYSCGLMDSHIVTAEIESDLP